MSIRSVPAVRLSSGQVVLILQGADLDQLASVGVQDTAADHTISLVASSDEGADRQISIPALGKNVTLALIDLDQVITGKKTFGHQKLAIRDTADDHRIDIEAAADEAADRVLTIPAMGGNRTLVLLETDQVVSGEKIFAHQRLAIRDTADDHKITIQAAADEAADRVLTIPAMGSDKSIAFIEEGTWTPVLAGASVAGSHTYTSRAGTYLVLGQTVILTWDILIASVDAAMSGALQISGWHGSTGVPGAAQAQYWGVGGASKASAEESQWSYVDSSGTVIKYSETPASGTGANTDVSAADLESTNVRLSGMLIFRK